jgi:signal transduction histidine kinase
MRSFRPIERLIDRSVLRWIFDVLVAVLAWMSSLPYLLHDNPDPPPLGAALPVLAVLVAPLVLRRVHPVPVFAWLLTGAIATGLWNQHVVPALALLIALFTIASLLPRKDAVIATGVLEAAVIGAAIYVIGSDFWYDAIFVSGLVGAALGLGLYAATRRAYLDELHDRAERLERERDQQIVLAAATERARITREMHDVVAHHLTVMVALSDGAIAATAASPERGIEVMRSVSATGRRALADTRRLLGVLRHDAHEDEHAALHPMPGLAELDVLFDRVRAAGLATTFEVHGSAVDVPSGVQLTVFRLVQEALTNTLKHGGSRARASVRLRYLADELVVEVVDDGVGVEAVATAGVGGGLAGMRERVYAYGGDLSIGPGRPGGWRVSARLRLDEGGNS